MKIIPLSVVILFLVFMGCTPNSSSDTSSSDTPPSNGYKNYTWGMSVNTVLDLTPEITESSFALTSSESVSIAMDYFNDEVDGVIPLPSMNAEIGYSAYISKKQNLVFFFLDDKLVQVEVKDVGKYGLKQLQDKYGQVKVQHRMYSQAASKSACWEDPPSLLIVWGAFAMLPLKNTWWTYNVYFMDREWFSKIKKLTLDTYGREQGKKKQESLSRLD